LRARQNFLINGWAQIRPIPVPGKKFYFCGVIDYIQTHLLELAGVLISLAYLTFSVRQIIWLWPLGILSALLYFMIYLRSGFYAIMSLQVYYVVVSIYGWYHWQSGGNHEKSRGTILLTSRMPFRVWRLLLPVLAAITLALWYVLTHHTDSDIPLWDSLTTSGSIVATWMLARKYLENCLVWIMVDAGSVLLYLSQGLYPTAALFVVYTVMAVVGYISWKNRMSA